MVKKHPVTGYLYVTLLNALESAGTSNGRTVHLVCGAGTGTQLMYLLRSGGYNVTTGALNVLDSDYDAASQLNIHAVSEAPFSPITPEAYAEVVGLMKKADIIVISEVPFGRGNLKNLEAVLEAGTPVIMVEKEELRDFTDGIATALLDKIKAAGAGTVKTGDQMLEKLRMIK
jgi:iron complex transport system ATP-binding protein